jgi:hypothetical protein
MGKRSRDAHRSVELAAQREVARRAERRRVRRPYLIEGVVVVVAAVVIFFVVTSTGGPGSSSSGTITSSRIVGLQTFPENDHQHVTGAVVYDRTPPAGGAHSAVWQNCGVYDQPVANEHAVHSMEHGAVWITYRPDLSAGEIGQLQLFSRTHATGSQGYVLLSPHPGLESPVVASTWGAKVALTGPGDPRLAAFTLKYAGGGQGGEKGGECTQGTGSPL